MVKIEIATETEAGRGNACGGLQSREPTPACGDKGIMTRYWDDMSKEKDMNVKEKAHSKEYVDKVEDLDVQKRWASREELNIDPKDRESKEVVSQGGEKKKARSAASLRKKPALEGVFAVLLLTVSHALGAVFNETKQVLPHDCLEFVKNGCPDLFWESRAFGEDCCQNYPDSDFHCQKDEVNGTAYIIAACLPEQLVPPGKMGRLILNETGYPELDLDLDCEPDTYRSENISSSLIRFRYCTDVKLRAKYGEDIICDGGPSAAYLLICKEGFTSQCIHAFSRPSAHDHCFCEDLPCEEGSKPFRNVTGKCDDGNITVEYGCTPEVRPLSTTTGLTSGASESTPILSKTSSPHPAHTTSTTAPGQDQQGNMSAGKIAGIIVGVFICIIGVGILIYCCWQYYFKTNSASGSPSVSSHDEKDSAAVLMEDIEDL